MDGIAAAVEIIAPLAARIEAERRLPEEAVRALVAAGAFKMLVPRALGGGEVAPREALQAIETVARADGSAGWCVMISATTGIVAALLPEETARAIFAPDDAIACGVFAPTGRAVREGASLRVSGRWAFGSHCENSGWRMGGVMIDGEPPQAVLLRADETRVIDTWHTSGLRGTGSHDFEAKDVLVPAERLFSLVASKPWPSGALYRFPIFGLLASGIAAVAIGIAQGALDSVLDLARAKHALGAKRSIAHREIVQLAVATAAAKIRAARALLHDAVGEVERDVTLESRAELRAAASQAVELAASAVDLAYDAGGGTSIYETSPLQRCFRDVHTLTQHVMVAKTSTILAGRVMLGVESDTALL
ncbi:MAG TPA: acyl-CoA dehydrogenase family protein [Labilithrix sp.]|jgi:alkylation response protein AidB-like acyl-CoA dehydrogenase